MNTGDTSEQSVPGLTQSAHSRTDRTRPERRRQGARRAGTSGANSPAASATTGPRGIGTNAGVDAAFITVLCGGALAGLHTTYSGWWFLAVGVIGLALGLAISQLANALRLPVLTLAALTAVVYFVAGPALVDRTDAIGGALPSPAALRTLASASVFSWKQLLTTTPPVPSAGILLAVPFILGLAAGAAGLTASRRLTPAAAPLAVPIVLLGTAIALGTREPGQWTVTALVIAVLSLVWASLRSRRPRPSARSSAQSARAGQPGHLTTPAASHQASPAARAGAFRKVAAATTVLAIAAGGGALVSPLLPGESGANRSVLRDSVTPPLDLNDYPSPLVGFRKYTKDANQLWDQTLFTVTGLPAGTPVRIATLNDYNGSVWGATNGTGTSGFDRVGSTIDPAADSTTDTSSGRAVTATITIAPAYAAAADTNAWLPTVGTVTGVSFGGSDSSQLAGAFRYNASTSSGLVLTRLQAGDTVTLHSVLTPTAVTPGAQPYGPPSLTNGYPAVFAARAAVWSKGASGLDAQLNSVAAYLRSSGAYSDGGAGETEYLPGHSIGRLTQFLNGPQPVGDDEQYAAAFALIANSLGMPARVVLGAIPEANGTVKGSDVHAWVEIHTANGAWDTIPDSDFMPNPSKKPDQQPPQPIENAGAAVVPPPNAIHPPSSAAAAGATASGTLPPKSAASSGWAWLGPLLGTLAWVLSPVFALLVIYGAIRGLKARRRHRRRTRGSAANRFAAGWRELVDHARDLGTPVPGTGTRHQQAAVLAAYRLDALADTADAVVYGPGDPSDEQAVLFWRQIDDARRTMSRAVGRRQRLLAAIDIRTLLPARAARSGAAAGAGAAGLVPESVPELVYASN